MAEPITIGGQTFVKTTDGWIDQKSKVRAPEGLLKLLNNLQSENSPEGKKKRVRVDTSRPVVKLGKTEYVWDLNSNVWIDKKTKDAANPSFSKLIETAYQGIIEGKTEEEKLYESWAKKAAAGQVFSGMGVAGQAAKQRVRTRTGSGQLPAPSIKINSPIVQMIEKLAIVDSLLKQRLQNQKLIAANNNIATREQQIETPASDAQPLIDEQQIDAEVESENKKSNAALIAVAIGAAGLIASQFDPIKEAFTGVVDFAKGVYGYLKDFMSITASGLESINSMGRSVGLGTTKDAEASAPASSTSASQQASPQSAAPQAQTSPSATKTPAGAPTGDATPAPPMSNGDEIVVTAPRLSSSKSGSSRSSSSNSSSPSSSISTPSSGSSSSPSTSAPDATRQTASPPTSTSPVQNNNDLAAAQNGTVWSGKDASGLTTFVRKINGKFETWTSADSTHYQIDDSQAATQISTRGLKNTNTDARKSGAGVSANIIEVNHPETGNGFGIAGANDSNGRPIVFSKEGAEAFAQMMQDSGGAVKPSDVASSKRSTSKNNEVGGASNSPHLRGVAMDIHGTSGAWIRQHGHRYNWRPHDYSGTHGGHFVFGENGMVPDEGSSSILERVVGAGVDLTQGAIEALGTIAQAAFGKQKTTSGSQLLDFNDTMAGNIDKAAREKTSAMIDSKTADTTATSIPTPISLSAASSSSSMQGIQTESDKSNVEWYLTRMGFPKVNYEQTSHA